MVTLNKDVSWKGKERGDFECPRVAMWANTDATGWAVFVPKLGDCVSKVFLLESK